MKRPNKGKERTIRSLDRETIETEGKHSEAEAKRRTQNRGTGMNHSLTTPPQRMVRYEREADEDGAKEATASQRQKPAKSELR